MSKKTPPIFFKIVKPFLTAELLQGFAEGIEKAALEIEENTELLQGETQTTLTVFSDIQNGKKSIFVALTTNIESEGNTQISRKLKEWSLAELIENLIKNI